MTEEILACPGCGCECCVWRWNNYTDSRFCARCHCTVYRCYEGPTCWGDTPEVALAEALAAHNRIASAVRTADTLRAEVERLRWERDLFKAKHDLVERQCFNYAFLPQRWWPERPGSSASGEVRRLRLDRDTLRDEVEALRKQVMLLDKARQESQPKLRQIICCRPEDDTAHVVFPGNLTGAEIKDLLQELNRWVENRPSAVGHTAA